MAVISLVTRIYKLYPGAYQVILFWGFGRLEAGAVSFHTGRHLLIRLPQALSGGLPLARSCMAIRGRLTLSRKTTRGCKPHDLQPLFALVWQHYLLVASNVAQPALLRRQGRLHVGPGALASGVRVCDRPIVQCRRNASIARGEIRPEPDGSVGQIAQTHCDDPIAGSWNVPPGIDRR